MSGSGRNRGKREINPLPGESREDYRKRMAREAPPMTEGARRVLRAAAREYWAVKDRVERRILMVDRRMADRRIRSVKRSRERERRKDERRKHDRRVA